MPFYTDQLYRTIELSCPPQRIVSLVPSQTELLYDLGLDEEVVGITKFCIHPENWFKSKERIGGTKKVNLEKIKALQPDLIIANKEENVRDQVEALAQHFPVWVSDVNNLEEACQMITGIATITNRKEAGKTMTKHIQSAFARLGTTIQYKVAYLIWKNPYMTIGGDTFIHYMLQTAGFDNLFGDRKRYPEVTIADLQAVACEVLFLSSEPYPFQQKHIDELQEKLPNTKILLVDGELFSWYGSRLLKAPAYFENLHRQIRSMV